MTSIKILFFEGCPNHPPVVDRIKSLIEQNRIDATIEMVEVTDNTSALATRFLGSPTVQVNGIDIEPAARSRDDFAMACRVYNEPDGLPSESMILDAIHEATSPHDPKPSDKVGLTASIGGVGTALLASACCWLPIGLALIGASASGVASTVERWRPALFAASGAMIAIGFMTTSRSKNCCTDGACKPARSMALARGIVWASAIMVITMAVFPNVIAQVMSHIDIGPSQTTNVTLSPTSNMTHKFAVSGLTCSGCAVRIEQSLGRIDGVTAATVDYDNQEVMLQVSNDSALAEAADSIRSLGFEPHIDPLQKTLPVDPQ